MGFKVLLLSALFSVTAHGFIQMEDRAAVLVEGELLTPFWATEYIGADLVKAEMNQRHDIERVPFAIYDTGFEEDFVNNSLGIQVDVAKNGRRKIIGHHGTNVANIINGEGLQSVSDVVDYVQLKNVSPAVFYFSAVREIKSLSKKPMVISNSVGWSGSSLQELPRYVDDLGIVWVLASGNEYPEEMSKGESEAPVVLVGSYSPSGQQTIYSQESKNLAILAPADEYMAATDGKGQKVMFGATSGATPLVSATIANAKSIMPSLNRTQAISLIKKTAIRSLNFYYRENKTGLFNAYKFFSAVSEIKEVCQTDLECIEREIQSFKDLKTKVVREHKTAREYCSGQEKSMTNEALNELRKDFLRSPQNSQLSMLLSCIYKKAGYLANAHYYENINLIYHNPRGLQEKIRNKALLAIRHDYKNSSSLRDLELLEDNFSNVLEKIIESGEGVDPYTAKSLLKRFNETPKVLLNTSGV